MTASVGAVHLDIDDRHVATILIDRPSKLNALSMEMVAQLQRCITRIRDINPRAVVLRTAGTKAFCVGADISQFSTFDAVGMWRRWIADGHRVFRELSELTQPTIAVIQGVAFGGGLELALTCDFRLAGATATFALPETGIGTIPGWGGTDALTRTVGRSRANELILARRRIDADTALTWGLINEYHPADELDAAVERLVAELLGGAPIAQQAAKQLIRAAADGPSAAVLEALASGFTSTTADFEEGLAAFLEKRPPHFSSASGPVEFPPTDDS
jgi:enoyl-CoA hydratase/carnithine racemase